MWGEVDYAILDFSYIKKNAELSCSIKDKESGVFSLNNMKVSLSDTQPNNVEALVNNISQMLM